MATKNKPAADAAPVDEVKSTKPVKAKPATITPAAKAPKAVKPKAPEVDKTEPPKAKKAIKPKAPAPKVAEVEEPKDGEEVDSLQAIGRKQLADGVRSRMHAAGFGVSPALATAMVQCFEDTVQNALAAGTEVTLPGFGKFKVTRRAAGVRRNPRTGDQVSVDASWAPSFKVGKALKIAVNVRPAG